MTTQLEYHKAVQRWIPASVAVFGMLLLPAFLVSAGHAQIHGVPSSVTSQGFGGNRTANAPRASVTSLGPHGFAPRTGVHVMNPNRNPNRNGDRHHRDHFVVPYYGGFYGAPYAMDNGYAEDDSDYQGGPTVFDRRGPGPEGYVAPRTNSENTRTESEPAPPVPDTPQTPTVLVFKDGHQMEVGNYAIVGPTLFDLSEGHRRKIPLADLDLQATGKQNDDRGVDFRLPPTSLAN